MKDQIIFVLSVHVKHTEYAFKTQRERIEWHRKIREKLKALHLNDMDFTIKSRTAFRKPAGKVIALKKGGLK